MKLYNSIHPDWVKPLAAHAHRRGMVVSGHVPAFMRAELAKYERVVKASGARVD